MKSITKDFFEMFQRGYTKKDIGFIDEYMNTLFEDGVEVAVIGTGNSELFHTKEEVKELIEGDWLYWGDLSLHMDSIFEKQVGIHQVFVVRGDLRYMFQEVEETYTRYQEYIQEIIGEANVEDVEHIRHQHMRAHYVIDQFLHKRPDVKRFNDYPIVLVFVCKEVKGEYKVRALTFGVPPNGEYPDERLHKYTQYPLHFEGAQKAMKEKGEKLFIPSFQSMRLASGFTFIDVDGQYHHEKGAVHEYKKRIKYYDEILVNEEVGMVYQDEDFMTVIYTGYVKKEIKEVDARRDLHHRINGLLSSSKSHKDQLFAIRREMSIVNKEIALGSMHEWPFRVFVVMRKVEGEFVLELVQFGYPMDMILEDKYL